MSEGERLVKVIPAPWNEKEDSILQAIYPNKPKEVVLSYLPNRTWSAIQQRAHILKIRRVFRPRSWCKGLTKETDGRIRKRSDALRRRLQDPSVRKDRRLWLKLQKDELHQLYWEEKLSTRQIAELKDVSVSTVQLAMKKYGIKTRNLSEALKNAYITGVKSRRQQTGSKNPNWRGGRFKDDKGYIRVYCPNFNGRKGRYVAEHIIVWERAYGTRLPKGYVIHHLNGTKDDNRLENLVALPVKQHNPRAVIKAFQRRIRELEEELRKLKEG